MEQIIICDIYFGENSNSKLLEYFRSVIFYFNLCSYGLEGFIIFTNVLLCMILIGCASFFTCVIHSFSINCFFINHLLFHFIFIGLNGNVVLIFNIPDLIWQHKRNTNNFIRVLLMLLEKKDIHDFHLAG